ncbi:molybdopterin-dependent oxidoreductase [Yinghuangia aomiensis]
MPNKSGARPSPPARGCASRRCSPPPAPAACEALWVVGEDVCATDPDTTRIAEALDTCPLVVCNELFLSETARRADVVLPVASWLEKDGTFVNFDRRFQRVRAAVAPPPETRTDFAVVHALAAALGLDLGCPTPAAALDECARVGSALRGPVTRTPGPRRRRPMAVPPPRPTGPGRPVPGAFRHPGRESAPGRDTVPAARRTGRRRLSPAPGDRPSMGPLQLREHDPPRRQPRIAARRHARPAPRRRLPVRYRRR